MILSFILEVIYSQRKVKLRKIYMLNARTNVSIYMDIIQHLSQKRPFFRSNTHIKSRYWRTEQKRNTSDRTQ